jgi:hypothetical protein
MGPRNVRTSDILLLLHHGHVAQASQEDHLGTRCIFDKVHKARPPICDQVGCDGGTGRGDALQWLPKLKGRGTYVAPLPWRRPRVLQAFSGEII